MSSRKRIVISVVCAVLAAALVAGYAASVRSGASAEREEALRRYGGETVSVCVATRSIEAGETFSDRNVAMTDWLVDLLPEGAVQDADEVIGKAAAAKIAANTPVCLIDAESQTMTLDVPEGMTALSVPCTAQSAVGGALAPGADVDVYVVDQGSAKLLGTGVRVLQTSSSTTNPWVTVAVDPSRVEALIAAASLQNLYFVLPSEGAAAQSHAAVARTAPSSAGDTGGATAQTGSQPAATGSGGDAGLAGTQADEVTP
jgi:pilus assembly protein CpaB